MTNLKTRAKSLKGRLLKSAATSALAFSTLTGALLVTGGSVSAQVEPPFGASIIGQNKNIFFFKPWGDQLDGDNTFPFYHVPITDLSGNPQIISYNIYDIGIGPNAQLDFDLYLYTKAPQYSIAPNQLKSFSFFTQIDPNEYQFGPDPIASFSYNSTYINACSTIPQNGNVINGQLICDFSTPLSVENNADFLDKIWLGTFSGFTIAPGTSPDDGNFDFKLILNDIKYSDNSNVAMLNGQFQDVEVQQPTPPAPGPLPILGAAAAFRFCRKARKLSARNKSLSIG